MGRTGSDLASLGTDSQEDCLTDTTNGSITIKLNKEEGYLSVDGEQLIYVFVFKNSSSHFKHGTSNSKVYLAHCAEASDCLDWV